MKTLHLLSAIMVILVFATGCVDNWSPSTSPSKAPAAEVAPVDFDFGFVQPYTILPYTFHVRSAGTSPLTYYRYSGTSWTRLGEYPGDDWVMPGDSLPLVGWYRSQNYNSPGYRPITVYFNDGDVEVYVWLGGKQLAYFEHPLETDSLRREFPFTGSPDELSSSVAFFNTTSDTAWITPVLLPDSRVGVTLPEFIAPQTSGVVEIDVNGRPVGSSYYQAITFDVQTTDSCRYTIGVYREGN